MPRHVQLVLLPNLSAGYRPGVLNAHIKNHNDLSPVILAAKVNSASLVNKITHKISGCSTHIFPAPNCCRARHLLVPGLVLFVRGKDEGFVLLKCSIPDGVSEGSTTNRRCQISARQFSV
jgi:hypothetical protein